MTRGCRDKPIDRESSGRERQVSAELNHLGRFSDSPMIEYLDMKARNLSAGRLPAVYERAAAKVQHSPRRRLAFALSVVKMSRNQAVLLGSSASRSAPFEEVEHELVPVILGRSFVAIAPQDR